ncbi:glycine--tRNA ligase subunit beta [Aquimonas voraii]|uniref:Glycine--tRNA ligase beta subunit n=1 Tax=Aquimonas voraii TaxID=265719 RepID=A0A1G6SNK0_9GAMM|nr:glycyl-tRNA synthetase beta chain [Aquimonas voraii]
MSTAPLLIELGTEELPVKALPELAAAFADGVVAGLAKRGVSHGAARSLYSARRLAVLIEDVASEQPEQRSEVLGPYLNIGLDADGNPTPALKGFAQKNGVEWTALERTTDNKGERFVARSVKPGARTADLLNDVLADTLKAMPIPKPMRWGGHDYGFARPAHWLIVLLGGDIVEASTLGLKADRMSRGHRFHHAKPVWIAKPEDYIDSLRAAKVLVDADERRERIRALVNEAAQAVGGVARIDAGILEEVQCLNEWPQPITCSFEREFLRVPQEALIATMEANQKFFPVLDAEGRLTEHFIGIANIESKDPREVRKGYERVIRPRFADAKFFFDEDLKQGLGSMNEGLRSVTYQQKLGSYADKVARIAALARSLAPAFGVDAELAACAAGYCKADLQSRMVGEFPELQGIAGRYYAAAAGEPVELAAALDEVYMPRFAGDAIAPSKLGQLLAVAERLDTLAGGFAAGLKPTGNKDPFALRRNALGLARTLIEGGVNLSVDDAIEASLAEVGEHIALQLRRAAALKALPEGAPSSAREAALAAAGADSAASRVMPKADDIAELRDFIFDRLRGYYADQGVPSQQFEAVLELKPASLTDFDARLKAIAEFAQLPEAAALAAANKRIRNILRKSEDVLPEQIDESLFEGHAESGLHGAIEAAIAATDPLLAKRDYVGVLMRLAQLRPKVDGFFEAVMVMAEDPKVRGNRLALLKRLSDRFLAVADVSQLAVG